MLGFEPDGGVAHRLVLVEKKGVDTLHAARLLARAAQVPPRDVGFAGLKDRHAVARQWFSLPMSRNAPDWSMLDDGRLRICRDEPHSRKLRRGALRGNRFHLRLRECSVDPLQLAQRAAKIAEEGVPNYFGPQRFGRDADNLRSVAAWLESGELPRGREARAFVYSAARSLLFNRVLAARVRAGTWAMLLPGERVNLAGRNSWFVADVIDATLLERLARHDIHPTGPMPGRGELPAGVAGELEARVLAADAALVQLLAQEGVEASRRALRVCPEDLAVARVDDGVELSFGLTSGSYATMLVREMFETATFAEGGDDAQD